jgi:hypothetical protein
MTDTSSNTHKIKAIDINTESIKLYISIAVASIAGLIAYHNSTAIEHNEIAFKITLIAFILSAITSVITLNSYIISVDNNEIEVTAKLPVWLNRFAIIFFIFGLVSAGFYFGLSKQKNKEEVITNDLNGIIIHGDRIEIGNNVKTHIKITRDSSGTIREIIIPNP